MMDRMQAEYKKVFSLLALFKVKIFLIFRYNHQLLLFTKQNV